MITGHAVVCGVMGDPVGHSLSPLMHNDMARAMGLDYIYVPCHVREGSVSEAVAGAFALGFTGLNVTVPYKQQVMPCLVSLDESAEAVGAVNTLVRCENGYRGYNTDADGLGRAMKEHGMEIGGRRCILLGAGGAAKAAAWLLMRERAESVVILNRSLEKAELLAAEMNRKAGRSFMKALPLDGWRRLDGNSYLAIQTTSVGMAPGWGRAVIEDADFYKKISQAVDVVYTPARTRFMEYVEAAGGCAINGLTMLIYQGIASLELWNPGVKVPREIAEQARRLLEERLSGRHLVLIGFMGAGKTTVGRILSRRLSREFLDTDAVIERQAGMTVSRIFGTRGEEAFRETETEVLRELAGRENPAVISAGGGVPLRAENRKLLREMGCVVYLKVNAETVLARLSGDTARPLLQGGGRRQKVETLLAGRDPVYREAAHVTVDADGRGPEEIAGEILEKTERFLSATGTGR